VGQVRGDVAVVGREILDQSLQCQSLRMAASDGMQRIDIPVQ
jgi:hypothetical protein